MSGVHTERWHAMGNIAKRTMNFEKAGDIIDLHFHNFDHVLYCVTGRLEALIEGESVRLQMAPGDSVTIAATKRHQVWALQDNSRGDCIFAHRTPQGEVVQECTGWEEAYTNRSNPPTPEILAALARGEDTHGQPTKELHHG